jgi:hypothetical protein
MPVLSHLHQLFNAEYCQAYIHTLRWKDRPLHCPRCQSHHIGPWGTYHYRPGCQRYSIVERAPLLAAGVNRHLTRGFSGGAKPPEPGVSKGDRRSPLVKGGVKAPPAKRQCRAAP